VYHEVSGVLSLFRKLHVITVLIFFIPGKKERKKERKKEIKKERKKERRHRTVSICTSH
jgi:hypothetical protein